VRGRVGEGGCEREGERGWVREEDVREVVYERRV
jgi:hypothetical protein